MSGEEDRILKQIKPCIEKMVMEVTRQQPEDPVNNIFYHFNNIGQIYDRLPSEIWRIHFNRINHR